MSEQEEWVPHIGGSSLYNLLSVIRNPKNTLQECDILIKEGLLQPKFKGNDDTKIGSLVEKVICYHDGHEFIEEDKFKRRTDRATCYQNRLQLAEFTVNDIGRVEQLGTDYVSFYITPDVTLDEEIIEIKTKTRLGCASCPEDKFMAFGKHKLQTILYGLATERENAYLNYYFFTRNATDKCYEIRMFQQYHWDYINCDLELPFVNELLQNYFELDSDNQMGLECLRSDANFIIKQSLMNCMDMTHRKRYSDQNVVAVVNNENHGLNGLTASETAALLKMLAKVRSEDSF